MSDVMTKQSSIIVARAEAKDRAAIMKLATQGHNDSIFGDQPFSPTKYDKLFNANLEKPERCALLKAELDGKIIGFLHCTLGQHFMADGDLIASVIAIYVNRRCQKTLLGGKTALRLVKSVTSWAKANNAYMTLFYVTSGTNIAQTDTMFRKLGATTIGGNYGLRMT